jgi:hypothetical protein
MLPEVAVAEINLPLKLCKDMLSFNAKLFINLIREKLDSTFNTVVNGVNLIISIFIS